MAFVIPLASLQRDRGFINHMTCWWEESDISAASPYVNLWVSSLLSYPINNLSAGYIILEDRYVLYNIFWSATFQRHSSPLIWLILLSQFPHSHPAPDKKKPLPRCFTMHYETVAMATLSEQGCTYKQQNRKWQVQYFTFQSLLLFFLFFFSPFCETWTVVLKMPKISLAHIWSVWRAICFSFIMK